ncbi:SAM-dependent methyltransferase, putative [Geobacter metallireducens GS-15]|uniref:SAM-dependent methyltransferase, putative n=1 Tax=Geobacter metallireducens (strain ATCC 53774 / DSM 7210 / GS-15) TaxID=269799 RepID=Q39TL8_GEOMG|nr:SAM-dependent methyltransferase, putative [Geobacter metallireducens GS-15]
MDNIRITTEPRRDCLLCGRNGNALYEDLGDRLFGAPGKWTLEKCVNDNCGLVWLNPAPRKDEIWKAYASYYTHGDNQAPPAGVAKRIFHCVRDCYLALKYDYFNELRQSPLRFLGTLLYLFPGRRADVDFSVMYLRSRPGGRLLEIGCGSGTMLSYLGSLGWRTEGIDVDPSAVANARSKGLNVAQGDLLEQPYGDNTFDAVMISHVIEHVPNPVELLTECYRILKPGGVLSLVTPNVESMGSHLFGRHWLHLDPPRHLILYNVRTIRALARKAGFTNMEIRTTIRDAHALFWASYSISRRGTYAMGSQPGRSGRLFMLLMRLVEWGLLKVFPHKGEELSLMGVK